MTSAAPSTARSRALLAALVAALTTTLGACSSSPSMTSKDAQARYAQALQDVVSATTQEMDLEWTTKGPPVTQKRDDGCVWFSQTMVAEVDLGAAKAWPRFVSSTKAALEKHGLAQADTVEIPGGYTGVEATDEHGATLRASSKGTTSLQLSVPVSDGC